VTTPDFEYLDRRMRAAKAELDEYLEKASRDLLTYKRENQPTPEEQRALQQAALRGELGDDMRDLARYIERGEDTWDDVFSGRSPNKELLRGHLDRQIEANREAIARAFEEEEFDPSQPPPEDE
jgi:hypothetical protein